LTEREATRGVPLSVIAILVPVLMAGAAGFWVVEQALSAKIDTVSDRITAKVDLALTTTTNHEARIAYLEGEERDIRSDQKDVVRWLAEVRAWIQEVSKTVPKAVVPSPAPNGGSR
jgi:hypothetical protein